MYKDLFFEKFFTILICIVNENKNSQIEEEFRIFHNYAMNKMEGYNCDIDRLENFEAVSCYSVRKIILANLLYLCQYESLLKTDYLEIRARATNRIILLWYKNKDIKMFIEKLEELAPHLYDAIYLNWETEDFNSREFYRGLKALKR